MIAGTRRARVIAKTPTARAANATPTIAAPKREGCANKTNVAAAAIKRVAVRVGLARAARGGHPCAGNLLALEPSAGRRFRDPRIGSRRSRRRQRRMHQFVADIGENRRGIDRRGTFGRDEFDLAVQFDGTVGICAGVGGFESPFDALARETSNNAGRANRRSRDRFASSARNARAVRGRMLRSRLRPRLKSQFHRRRARPASGWRLPRIRKISDSPTH